MGPSFLLILIPLSSSLPRSPPPFTSNHSLYFHTCTVCMCRCHVKWKQKTDISWNHQNNPKICIVGFSLTHKWRCHSSNSPWTWHECIAPKGVKESQRNLLMFWQPTRLCCWGYKPTSQFMFLSAKQNIAPKYPTPLCYSSKTKQHQRRIGCHGNTYPCRENIDVHQDMLFKKHWTKDIDANGPVALPQ